MFSYIRNKVNKNPNQNLIIKVINRIFIDRYQPPKLGRWALIHDHRVDRKIDWSNEDHCGPCGSLKLDKNTPTKIN